MRPPLEQQQLDDIAGRVFATPSGKEWLLAHEQSHPAYVAEIRARIARCRARWGDRTNQKDAGQ